ncbi:hypothetical protein BC936DRAFT_146146 [Jimgerdemannia flammicorona]|uniref:Uncharacterized protein n=2 Tax=Jimgerdemannia flammicorona TaxID=994334 RepID=A0A433D8A5_9FUNG|nr:hypothetical protein BC936DRAFT_146146 [Jimgerdemannia flammicorona]RUS30500.1 hypothetical protein BC938DRAFT_479316 [Jimgerdemannia flammicorona]
MADFQQQINSLPLSEDLLKYYKARIGQSRPLHANLPTCNPADNSHTPPSPPERSEKDYQDALSRIDAVRLAYEEQHRLTWELNQRMSDIAELQHAMSELQACVVRDRKQLLQVIGENDELKVQEVRDRRKIQYLLKLTGPTDLGPTGGKRDAGTAPGSRAGKGRGDGGQDRRSSIETEVCIHDI